MNAKQAQITNLLNQILTTAGCDKSTAILIAVKGFINEGLTPSQALDLVCGDGAAKRIAGESWEICQAA